MVRFTEFKWAFEQDYGRKMTIEERCIIEAIKEIIDQKLMEYSDKLG